MKALKRKIGLSILFAVVSNLLIITLAMYQESLKVRTAILLETAVFIVLQLLVIIFHFVMPLSSKNEKRKYWIISEGLTIITIWFWGFGVLGYPVWLNLR